jgi:hypothetical protein
MSTSFEGTSASHSSDSDSEFHVNLDPLHIAEHFRRRINPTAISEVVEEVRQAPVKKFGSFRVANKRVRKVSLRTPLQPDHSYNAVSFNVTVKKTAEKWVFVTGFEASGVLQEMSIFKLVGKDVNQYVHQKNHWELIHQKWYPMSWNRMMLLRLEEPVRLGPGETCGFYIHSNCETDRGLLYRSCAPGVVLEDNCIQVLHGWAHTSDIPFDFNKGWTRQHRVLSGNIFYEPTPLRWSPDRNFFWSNKTTFQLALDAVMTSSYFSPGILVELMTFCGMDWFDLALEVSDDGSSNVPSVEMLSTNRRVEDRQTSTTFTSMIDRLSGVITGVLRFPSNQSSGSSISHRAPNAPQQLDYEEKSPPPLEHEEDKSDGDESVVSDRVKYLENLKQL